MAEKQIFEMEFIIRTSPRILFTRLSTADGLAQWFADDVNINGNIFTFVWEGTGQDAKKIKERAGKSIRFHWVDDDDDCYFEFRLEVDELTSEVALMVTDFAEEDELEESKDLWGSQINSLMQPLPCLLSWDIYPQLSLSSKHCRQFILTYAQVECLFLIAGMVLQCCMINLRQNSNVFIMKKAIGFALVRQR